MIRFSIIGFLYRAILKRFLFLLDPEKVHDFMIKLGATLGKYSYTRKTTQLLLSYKDPILETIIDGVHYINPIGLAAGFDKNANLTSILPSVGFGHAEVGSITGEYCAGNPRPRLWRLPKSQSLVVYYGLKNDGAQSIARRLSHANFDFPIGISIAKTNSPNTIDMNAGIADYGKVFQEFTSQSIGSYFTINISCPNTFGGEPFTDPIKFDSLMSSLFATTCTQPIYIKLPAELTCEQVDELVRISDKYNIAGFICSNLAKKRNPSKLFDSNIPNNGGLSGKVVQDLSDNLIEYLYATAGSRYTIIGCGGVFTAEDAYRKILLGASLIQLITGMIYRGPQTIGEINYGLARLLRKDGYTSVSQAVGKHNKHSSIANPKTAY
jgi:dihydroorotate dehydrogenase